MTQESIDRLNENLERLCAILTGFAPFAADPRRKTYPVATTRFPGMETQAAGTPKDDE